MKRPTDPWANLAGAARQRPEPRTERLVVDATWAAAVAAKSMQVAALGKPSLKTLILAWLASWKVLVPLAVLLLGGVGWWAGPGNFGQPTPAERSAGWVRDTTKQLRAWLPMECDQAGQITILLQHRQPELAAVAEKPVESARLIEETQRQIDALLTPEQRAAFAAEQARLRAKWFPPD
jgi:hypothetical protein